MINVDKVNDIIKDMENVSTSMKSISELRQTLELLGSTIQVDNQKRFEQFECMLDKLDGYEQDFSKIYSGFDTLSKNIISNSSDNINLIDQKFVHLNAKYESVTNNLDTNTQKMLTHVVTEVEKITRHHKSLTSQIESNFFDSNARITQELNQFDGKYHGLIDTTRSDFYANFQLLNAYIENANESLNGITALFKEDMQELDGKLNAVLSGLQLSIEGSNQATKQITYSLNEDIKLQMHELDKIIKNNLTTTCAELIQKMDLVENQNTQISTNTNDFYEKLMNTLFAVEQKNKMLVNDILSVSNNEYHRLELFVAQLEANNKESMASLLAEIHSVLHPLENYVKSVSALNEQLYQKNTAAFDNTIAMLLSRYDSFSQRMDMLESSLYAQIKDVNGNVKKELSSFRKKIIQTGIISDDFSGKVKNYDPIIRYATLGFSIVNTLIILFMLFGGK